MQPPRNVKELFPSKYLTADDLRGRPTVVTIELVTFEELRQRDGKTELKGLLHFAGKQKLLVLNKTQALAISEIAGSIEFSAWPGLTIQIAPGRAQNGKDTIVISRAPAPRQRSPYEGAPPTAGADQATATNAGPATNSSVAEFDAWPSAGQTLTQRAQANQAA